MKDDVLWIKHLHMQTGERPSFICRSAESGGVSVLVVDLGSVKW